MKATQEEIKSTGRASQEKTKATIIPLGPNRMEDALAFVRN
jgi:hypothetical protein